MTRRSMLAVLLVLAFIVSPLSADWVSLTGERAGEPQITIITSDNNSIVVEVTVPGFYRDRAENGMWEINIPGNACTEELGKSSLPTISGILAVPADATGVTIADYQVLKSTEFTGVHAYPFQQPTTDDNDKVKFRKDKKHYASAEVYPAQNLAVEKIAVWRNARIVNFRMVPMSVNPAEETMTAHIKVRFTLNFEKGRTAFRQVQNSAAFEAMYRKMILNHTPRDIARERGKFLVISHESLESAIQPLVDWRKSQGYDVTSTKLGKVGSTAQDLKNFISSEYSSKGTSYVLLVGDPDELPMYKWDGRYPSDYWYSCVSGSDMYADLCVGRVAANNAAEVETYIRKAMAYENEQNNGTWSTKALLVSHEQGAPGKYEGCLEQVKKLSFVNKISFITRHGSDGYSNSDIKNEIDKGVGIVNYRGHGNTDCWSGWNGADFDNDNMKSLNNSVYPVFFSIACYNSRLDSYQETFAEACLKHPSGGGSAFLGASRPSYTVPNHDFCKYLFTAPYIEGIKNIGDISNFANAQLLKQYGSSSYASANVKMYLWLGDPCISVKITK